MWVELDSVYAMLGEYRKRRDFIVKGLNGIPGVTCPVPKGAFYVFPNITKTGWPSKKLADANVNITAVTAIGAGSGRYGMILWVAPAAYEKAAAALGA